jgi:hypothetical protein
MGHTDDVRLLIGEEDVALCNSMMRGDRFKMDRYGNVEHSFHTEFKKTYEETQNDLMGIDFFNLYNNRKAFIKLGGLTFRHIAGGAIGNDIPITYIDPGGATATLSITAHDRRAQLVHGNLKFRHMAGGVAGNAITITLVNPGGTGALDITASGNDITIALARTSGTITTTEAQLEAAFNVDADTIALGVVAELTGVGATATTAKTKTNLAGGAIKSGVYVNLGRAESAITTTEALLLTAFNVSDVTKLLGVVAELDGDGTTMLAAMSEHYLAGGEDDTMQGGSFAYQECKMGNNSRLMMPFYGPLPIKEPPYLEVVVTAVVGGPKFCYAFNADLSDVVECEQIPKIGTNRVYIPNSGEDFITFGIMTDENSSITVSGIEGIVQRYLLIDDIPLIQPNESFTIQVVDGEWSNHMMSYLHVVFRDAF